MIYARAFFDLQFEFAETVAAVSGRPLVDALLGYTNYYIRFGLGRDFDPAHSGWRDYLAGLRDAIDGREWTYRFYTKRAAHSGPPIVTSCGAFAYARLPDGRLRLHFDNVETDGSSPLARERRGQRLADLAALFSRIREAEREPLRVVGASWLYNVDAYRCLFPASYLATARVLRGRFQHMPLWGQFVNRRGEVKKTSADLFLERLRRQSSIENLDECFPLPVLGLEAAAREFYRFYGV